jgi:hypothetical protein
MELISTRQDNLGYQQTSLQGINWQPKNTCTDCNENCRDKKDCYVKQFRQGINKERVGTKWKPVTDRTIALKINRHPVLKRDTVEVHQLLKQCKEKGFTKIFFWATK